MLSHGGQEPAPAELFGPFDHMVRILDDTGDLLVEGARRFVNEPSLSSHRFLGRAAETHQRAFTHMVETVMAGDESLESKINTVRALTANLDSKRGNSFNQIAGVADEFETTTSIGISVELDDGEETEDADFDFGYMDIAEMVEKLGESGIVSIIQNELPEMYGASVDEDIAMLIEMRANPSATRRLDRELEIRHAVKYHGLDLLKAAVGASIGVIILEQFKKKHS